MDPHEQQAHDIICMIRYGSPGGNVRNDELRKVADYLRGGPKRPVVTVPVVPVVPTQPTVTVSIPGIPNIILPVAI